LYFAIFSLLVSFLSFISFFSPNFDYLGLPDPRTVHIAQEVSRKGLKKFGVNIWITDADMQCLASSPPISPLTKSYDKDSDLLVLRRAHKEYEDSNKPTKKRKKNRRVYEGEVDKETPQKKKRKMRSPKKTR
jgi:hypothetical protein